MFPRANAPAPNGHHSKPNILRAGRGSIEVVQNPARRRSGGPGLGLRAPLWVWDISIRVQKGLGFRVSGSRRIV